MIIASQNAKTIFAVAWTPLWVFGDQVIRLRCS
jgi:hypothetical protein